MRSWTIAIAMLLSCTRAAFGGELEPLHHGPTCDNWGAYRGLRSSGTLFSNGMQFKYASAVDTRNGRFVMHYVGSAGKTGSAQGFDGATSWLQDDSGASHAASSPHERMLAISQAWIVRRGWCANDFADASAHTVGTRVDASRTFDIIRVTPAGGLPFLIWIDRRTQLVDRTIVQLAESREIDHYSDWRNVAGMVLPFSERIEYPEDESVDTLTTRLVVPATKFSALTFAEPPAPADVTMLNGALSTTVPYRIEAQKPLVDVWLNGKGPFPFVIDTGGHFILTTQTARSLGVRGVGAANSLGQGARILKTSFGRIAKLQIGSAIVHDQTAKIVPYGYDRLERLPHRPKAGWLGLQFFERFRTTLNPLTGRLTLTPLARGQARPREPGVRLPLLFEEDTPVVACRIEDHPAMCMIDTGNAGPTIVEGHWLQLNGLTSHLKHGLEDDGERLDRTRIDIGPYSLRHELADFAPPAVRGSESTQVVAAILSQDVFDRFVATFDYGDGAMTLQPLGIPPQPFSRTGIGIHKRKDGSIFVSFVFANSPAAWAGIRVGDRIEAIDGVSASNLSSADIYTLSRGPIGKAQRYRIVRDGRWLTTSLRLRDLI